MPQTLSPEQWAAQTLNARRLARRAHAAARITRIADGSPRFTAEDLLVLAEILTSRAEQRDREKADAA